MKRLVKLFVLPFVAPFMALWTMLKLAKHYKDYAKMYRETVKRMREKELSK